MVADGLVVAGSNAALEAALSAAGGKSMADLPPVRALLAGLGEGATGVSILQAFAFWTAMYAPDTRLLPPGSGLGAGLLTPVEEDGPRLAQYLIGGLAEVRLADGTWRGRAVLVYPTLADATTAAVAMEERVKASTRDAPVATTRAARGVDGGLAVAILDVAPSGAARPGGAGSPFRDWVDAFMTRKPTPVVVGPVPSKPTPR